MLQRFLISLLPNAKDALNRVLAVYKAQAVANIDREAARVIKEINDPKSATLSPDAIKIRIISAIANMSGVPAYIAIPLMTAVATFNLANYQGELVDAVQAEVERIKRRINGVRL